MIRTTSKEKKVLTAVLESKTKEHKHNIIKSAAFKYPLVHFYLYSSKSQVLVPKGDHKFILLVDGSKTSHFSFLVFGGICRVSFFEPETPYLLFYSDSYSFLYHHEGALEALHH